MEYKNNLMSQLVFKFPFKTKYYEQDFYVSSNNFSAYKLLESWPRWPGKWLNVYGASGSAVLPFFVKTPTFTQQTVEEGFRLRYQWEKDLTDNLKNIKIFDKYKSGNDVYNSSPEELFDEFKEFYRFTSLF